MSPFYLTTPIYYANARPHLGPACTTTMADAMCRYRRLAGDRVYLLTGTEEHGERIAQVAAAAGKSPQAYADEIAGVFRETWQRLDITNDDFIRTTEPRHQKVVQEVLQRLHDAGEIYFGEYGGWYCYGCERFYTEKEIVDGKCPDHQTALTFIKEKNYFFKMSKYQAWLIKHLEDDPGFIQPDRYRNEVLGFLREPLQDLSISRPTSRLEWGIPLPFDHKYVAYGWVDALFSEEAFVDRLNADLANDLGNLASRASTLIAATGPVAQVTAPVEAADREIAIAAAEARATLEQAMEEFAFQKALGGIWAFIGAVNRYVDTSAPWALAKDAAKRPRLERVLCTLADSLGFLGVVLEPFLPDAARKIREAIGAPGPLALEAAVVGRLGSGPRVTKISGLFPRVDTKSPSTLSPQGRGPGEGSKVEGIKGEGAEGARIPITDFQKVELRVAEGLAAERVPKSKKLLKLSIRVGEETRTLVAGVAEHYEPAALVGRKVVIVANLEPATLMGVESNGMVLAASHEGTVSLLTLDKDVPSGSKVK